MKPIVMYENPTVYENMMKYLEQKVGPWEELSVDQKIIVIQKLERACKSCALHYDSKYENIPSRLNKDCKFIFIGRNPNGTEAQNNTLFPEGTRQGEIFKKYLTILNIGESEISILNMCCCYGRKNRPITQEEIGKCIPFKKMEFDCISDNVEIIFPMGQDALKWIYGLNHPGTMQCVGDIYESELNGRTIKVIPLIHPSQVLIDISLGKEVGQHLRSLREVVSSVRDK